MQSFRFLLSSKPGTIQEATVAEAQYARTQRSGGVMKPLRKKVMDLF
jgi:hypothetical protein